MIYCKILNKNFESKELLFNELKQSNDILIADKKSKVYKSIDKGQSVSAKPVTKFSGASKGLVLDDDYYYFAINTTKILDSHDDFHCDEIWERTAKNQSGKNYLVDTHTLSINTTIARKEDVEIFTATIPFAAIGKSYQGDTVALIYKVRKDKIIDSKAKEWIESGSDIEASVRMQYVDIVLCLNSDDKEDIIYKDNYDRYYPLIANKDEYEEIHYFYAVKEAKNVNEGSLVLFGSNSSTGIIESDPTKGLDSSIDTQEEKVTQKNYDNLIKHLQTKN